MSKKKLKINNIWDMTRDTIEAYKKKGISIKGFIKKQEEKPKTVQPVLERMPTLSITPWLYTPTPEPSVESTSGSSTTLGTTESTISTEAGPMTIEGSVDKYLWCAEGGDE